MAQSEGQSVATGGAADHLGVDEHARASRRTPRPREIAGLVLAFGGSFLIATGGDPTVLVIPPLGLAMGLLSAVAAACISIIPVKILPEYGSPIVAGSAMFCSGIVTSLFVQPVRSIPALDGTGWLALVVIGSFLAYMLYMQGVKDIGSVRASLIGTVEPVSATITSALFWGPCSPRPISSASSASS